MLATKRRRATKKELKESIDASVSKRVGFVINKIEALSFLADFDIDTLQGNIILNISYFSEDRLKEALKIIGRVFNSPYAISNRLAIAKSGEKIGTFTVPQGNIGVGTVCSIMINGIFLKAGIPVTSKFGGVIEIENGNPKRFISLISYEGSSLDPLVIFIRSGMTDVLGALKHNSGKVLGSFREIPTVSLPETEMLIEKMTKRGFNGIMLLGKPNQPLLDIPVGTDKVGMIVVGGLNSIAAIEEARIYTESNAMSTLYEYTKLLNFKDALKMFSDELSHP
ncbi:MAG: DUF128 domain-containing protein [Nitrospirota bacterium]|nr:DUF128 domain-containing protein [Nitrospirota bacterium]MDH5768917.1 DUF128 domain-containing protein [Nitrospirota bacterium]